MAQDRLGNPVSIGSHVKLIALPGGVVEPLSEGEAQMIRSMVGETFEVYEIDKHGHAWIEKWWENTDGTFESHSLGLSSIEMEIVPDDG